MKTNEEIELEKAFIHSQLGRTRAEWYEEACLLERDTDPAVLMWACRCRELTLDAARKERALSRLYETQA